ncbi:MAG: hypothetical protein PHZ07_01920 [Patescibacteria group bacterium]|nr:hypothetical protein [Patescibacteria group bacterium]MDD4304057.1 hypothetical protein [Patescibacteria group bacterium]MDD4694934.1 hypothetical protein [Patescibacteria group bacterium]
MYEIKKIVPFSFAKYVALIFLMLGFFSYLFSFLYDFVNSPEDFKTNFTADFARNLSISFVVDLLSIYILSFVITYLFIVVYNYIVRKTKMRGIVLEFDLVDDSILEKKDDLEKENQENIKKDDKFVV